MSEVSIHSTTGGATTPPRSAAADDRRPSAFGRFAGRVAVLSGQPVTFAVALAVVVVWAISGPVFRFSDTWQLVINTGTTLVTFLMVFVIQNAQNRDGEAIQVKLDELIRATENARNAMIGIEKLGESHVRALEAELEEQCAADGPAGEGGNGAA